MDILLRTPDGEMVRVETGAVRGVALVIDATDHHGASAGLAPAEARLLGHALIAAADEAVLDERS